MLQTAVKFRGCAHGPMFSLSFLRTITEYITRLSHRLGVRLSVRMSVCHTRDLYQNGAS